MLPRGSLLSLYPVLGGPSLLPLHPTLLPWLAPRIQLPDTRRRETSHCPCTISRPAHAGGTCQLYPTQDCNVPTRSTNQVTPITNPPTKSCWRGDVVADVAVFSCGRVSGWVGTRGSLAGKLRVPRLVHCKLWAAIGSHRGTLHRPMWKVQNDILTVHPVAIR